MNNIDDILNNYFEGAVQPEEENRLKEYFRTNAVLPQHQAYKSLFAAFDEEKQIAAPPFEIPIVKNNKKPVSSRKLWITVASAAAVILLIVILFPFKNKTAQESDYLVFINGKEITNPRKAQQYADKMFMQANEIIRAGYEPFIEVNAMETEMDAELIFNNLNKKINNMESEIINF